MQEFYTTPAEKEGWTIKDAWPGDTAEARIGAVSDRFKTPLALFTHIFGEAHGGSLYHRAALGYVRKCNPTGHDVNAHYARQIAEAGFIEGFGGVEALDAWTRPFAEGWLSLPPGDKRRYVIVCPRCGSDEVLFDATAAWCPVELEHVITTIHDHTMCQKCGHEADYGFIAVPQEARS